MGSLPELLVLTRKPGSFSHVVLTMFSIVSSWAGYIWLLTTEAHSQKRNSNGRSVAKVRFMIRLIISRSPNSLKLIWIISLDKKREHHRYLDQQALFQDLLKSLRLKYTRHSWNSVFIASKLARMSTALHISSIYTVNDISDKLCQYIYFLAV